MRIALICGGRDVGRALQKDAESATHAVELATAQRNFVAATLDRLHEEHPFSLIIGGNEGGAERLGVHWAATRKVTSKIFRRKSRLLKTEDIFQRNSRMLREGKPDVVIAFGSGESTEKLLAEALSLGLPTLTFDVPETL